MPKAGKPPDDWPALWAPFPDLLTHRGPRGDPLRARRQRGQARELRAHAVAGAVGLYVRDGYCWVVTGSTEEGRALVDPTAVPPAIAYYRALAAHAATRVYEVSPFAPGSAGVPFNFDWSFDYYPARYAPARAAA